MHDGVQPYYAITPTQGQSTVTTRLVSPAAVLPISVSIVPFSLAVILHRTYQRICLSGTRPARKKRCRIVTLTLEPREISEVRDGLA